MRQKVKRTKPTGRVNVYVLHSPGFFNRLRPAYDSAADVVGELTEAETSTLRSLISRYVAKCHGRHGCENVKAALPQSPA